MAVPYAQAYFFTAQKQHFTGWNLPNAPDPSKYLLINPNTAYTALSHMEMGFPTAPSQCPTICLFKKTMGQYQVKTMNRWLPSQYTNLAE